MQVKQTETAMERKGFSKSSRGTLRGFEGDVQPRRTLDSIGELGSSEEMKRRRKQKKNHLRGAATKPGQNRSVKTFCWDRLRKGNFQGQSTPQDRPVSKSQSARAERKGK